MSTKQRRRTDRTGWMSSLLGRRQMEVRLWGEKYKNKAEKDNSNKSWEETSGGRGRMGFWKKRREEKVQHRKEKRVKGLELEIERGSGACETTELHPNVNNFPLNVLFSVRMVM